MLHQGALGQVSGARFQVSDRGHWGAMRCQACKAPTNHALGMVQTSLTVCGARSSGFSHVTKPCTGLKPLLRTVKLKLPLLNHVLGDQKPLPSIESSGRSP